MDNISKLLEIGPRAQTNHWLWGKKKYGAISSEMVRWGRAWGCDSLYCCHAIFPQNSKKFAICIFHDHPSILPPQKCPKSWMNGKTNDSRYFIAMKIRRNTGIFWLKSPPSKAAAELWLQGLRGLRRADSPVKIRAKPSDREMLPFPWRK